MRQPFCKAAAEVKTFDELVDLDTPWFTVFELRRDGEAVSYISLAGKFERREGVTGEIVAKEHSSLEQALFQTEAFRKARSTDGKLVFTNVNMGHDALTDFMAHPLLPQFINPRSVPEDSFPEFTDSRMALKRLCGRTGIMLNL